MARKKGTPNKPKEVTTKVVPEVKTDTATVIEAPEETLQEETQEIEVTLPDTVEQVVGDTESGTDYLQIPFSPEVVPSGLEVITSEEQTEDPLSIQLEGEIAQVLIQGTITPTDEEQEPSEEDIATDAELPPVAMREVVLSTPNINALLAEVLYIAKLGGDLVPDRLPRLTSMPYTVRMLIPADVDYTQWDVRNEFDPTIQYNEITIRTADPLTLARILCKVGKSGAFLAPGKQSRVNSAPYVCSLLSHLPVETGPNIIASPQRVKYTREEMGEMKLSHLKIIGSWLGVTGRGKVALIKAIVDKYKEKEITN